MRDYEDMSKQELITLVKRLSEQHNEWRNETIELREEYDYFKRPADYLLVRTVQCGCDRTRIWNQSHCFCDYEYQVEGTVPTIELRDDEEQFYHTISEDEYIEERECAKQARLRKEMKA
jgi:hypothetical protein